MSDIRHPRSITLIAQQMTSLEPYWAQMTPAHRAKFLFNFIAQYLAAGTPIPELALLDAAGSSFFDASTWRVAVRIKDFRMERGDSSRTAIAMAADRVYRELLRCELSFNPMQPLGRVELELRAGAANLMDMYLCRRSRSYRSTAAASTCDESRARS